MFFINRSILYIEQITGNSEVLEKNIDIEYVTCVLHWGQKCIVRIDNFQKYLFIRTYNTHLPFFILTLNQKIRELEFPKNEINIEIFLYVNK